MTATRLLFAFIAGILGVLVFHQAMLGLLFLLGVTSSAPWPLTPTLPLGVPDVLSAAFWGGLWGIVMVLLVVPRLPPGTGRWIGAFLFGAIFPTLVAWFVVAPLKGMPLGNGFSPAGVVTGILVNGAWGVGTLFFLDLLDRSRRLAV